MFGGDRLAFVEGEQRSDEVRAVAGAGVHAGAEQLVLLAGEGLIVRDLPIIECEEGRRREEGRRGVGTVVLQSAGVHGERQRQQQPTGDSHGQIHAGPPLRARGSVKWTVVPLPRSLSTQICPPCASTTFLASASPRPLPARVFFDYGRPR